MTDCIERRMLYKVFRYLAKIDDGVERAAKSTEILGRYGSKPEVRANIQEIRKEVIRCDGRADKDNQNGLPGLHGMGRC